MSRGAMRGLLAAGLLAAVVTTARAADDDDANAPPPKPPPSGVAAWWNGMFGSPPKPPEKVEKKKPDRPARPHILTAAESAALRTREKEAYCRRVQVCIKLHAIAMDRHDDAMEAQINELENTMLEVYQQRLASLAQEGINEEPQEKQQQAFGTHGSNRSRNTAEDDQ